MPGAAPRPRGIHTKHILPMETAAHTWVKTQPRDEMSNAEGVWGRLTGVPTNGHCAQHLEDPFSH